MEKFDNPRTAEVIEFNWNSNFESACTLKHHVGEVQDHFNVFALVYYSDKIYNFVEIGFKIYVMPKSKWRYYKKNGKSYEWCGWCDGNTKIVLFWYFFH